jgi:hypothetical protein
MSLSKETEQKARAMLRFLKSRIGELEALSNQFVFIYLLIEDYSFVETPSYLAKNSRILIQAPCQSFIGFQ